MGILSDFAINRATLNQMHRTDHSQFRKRHDFVSDFSHAEQRTRIVIRFTAAMTIETHHCHEDHAPVASA
jgi:hypothetical protein